MSLQLSYSVFIHLYSHPFVLSSLCTIVSQYSCPSEQLSICTAFCLYCHPFFTVCNLYRWMPVQLSVCSFSVGNFFVQLSIGTAICLYSFQSVQLSFLSAICTIDACTDGQLFRQIIVQNGQQYTQQRQIVQTADWPGGKLYR